jgi:hypothetical protein
LESVRKVLAPRPNDASWGIIVGMTLGVTPKPLKLFDVRIPLRKAD